VKRKTSCQNTGEYEMVAKTIQLEAEGFLYREAIASGTLKPGNLLRRSSATEVAVHNDEGGRGLVMVVVENALLGQTVADEYDSGDKVFYHIQRPGTAFQALLKANQSVVPGDALISDGAGLLIKASDIDSSASLDAGSHGFGRRGHALCRSRWLIASREPIGFGL
jgi:hypothetical protein